MNAGFKYVLTACYVATYYHSPITRSAGLYLHLSQDARRFDASWRLLYSVGFSAPFDSLWTFLEKHQLVRLFLAWLLIALGIIRSGFQQFNGF